MIVDAAGLKSYLLQKSAISIENIKVKDIPDVVLKLMQYAEELHQNGSDRKEFVISAMKVIAEYTKLTDQDLSVVDSLIESYIAIDKSVEVIHKMKSYNCCIVL